MSNYKNQTYSFNRNEVRFTELPEDLQENIKQAHDFFTKLDAAKTPEEGAKVCREHPHNQL
jgi:hypothetical protein